MVYYVYRVEWNNNLETETFENFEDAKELVKQKWATEDPKYVSPFIYEIELAEDENGIAVPTGNDECVFSWDSQKPENNPELRQPKLFDDSEYVSDDADFDVYDEFDVTEKAPEPEDPYEGRTLFDYDFDEALSALNEADDKFGECQCCHEEFPKSELIKEGSRYICKECAGNLSEDVAEESLEETVPEDLADDRTPIQGDVHELDEPVDYKKEIAKEKLVDESLTEDVDLDEAIFDGHARVAKKCDDPGKEVYFLIDRTKNDKIVDKADTLESAIAKCKGNLSDTTVGIVLGSDKHTKLNKGIGRDLLLSTYVKGKEVVSNYKQALEILDNMLKTNTSSNNTEVDVKDDEHKEEKADSKPVEQKLPTEEVVAALKKQYPNNDKQIRVVTSMLKKAGLAESLEEDLDQDLQKWNAYVNYLRGQIEQEEKALEKAGDNDLVKAAIQRRIDAFKADLEEALPNLVKTNEEPEDIELDLEDDHEEEVKESLNEAFDMDEFNRFLAAAKKLGLETAGDLDKFSKEHGGVTDLELLKVMEEEAAKLD